jgi:hypothetical protein
MRAAVSAGENMRILAASAPQHLLRIFYVALVDFFVHAIEIAML